MFVVLCLALLSYVLSFTVQRCPIHLCQSYAVVSPLTTALLAKKGRLQKSLSDMNESSNNAVVRSAAGRGASRREKSEVRNSMSAAERKAEKSLVDKIMTLVGESKRDLTLIQAAVDELQRLNSAQSLRTIINGRNAADYQLSFAWDDSAVSFIGTGLHKVPLARLDYFFLTLSQGNVFMREVIRIIGPFPTVLNTLRGKASVEKGGSSGGEAIKFVIDSVVDGTGKELVGEDPRIVDLPIIYASDQVIVGDVGEGKLLIFTREEDVDSILYEKNVGDEKKNKI